MRDYRQAEPPGCITWVVFVVTVAVLTAGIVYVALKVGGWI